MYDTTNSTPHPNRWRILALIGVAQLMVVLDATITNIALPSAQADLGFSDAARQWVITAYALAFGSLLLLGGRLGDLFGRKRAFIGGLAGFAVASAIGGAAQSFEVLVGARALQGVFAALLAPAGLSLLTTTFTHRDERGRAFAIYGAIAGGGGALGLLLGGVLTEYLNWRWCLYVNLLIAVPAAIAALRLLENQAHAAKPQLDIRGTLAASAGVFGIVFGFSRAEADGWTAPSTLGFILGGVALLVLFVAIQRRAEHPLLPLRVVRDRNRAGAYIAVGIVGAGMFGVFLFLTYYLQRTLGFSPVQTGLAFLPMIGVLSVTAAIAQTRVLPRTGPKPLITAGSLVASAAMMLLAQVTADSTYVADVLPPLLIMGGGIGLLMATAMSTATLGVDPRDAGVGSALVNTCQQVGGSVGTALLSTISASAVTAYAEGKVPTKALAAQAEVHGFTTAFWVSAAIFAAGAVVSGLLLRPGVPEYDAAAGPLPAH